MPTTGDFVTAARAKTLVQLICGEPDAGADPNFERTARVAHAVGTYRQRAIVWVRQILEWACTAFSGLAPLPQDLGR